MLQSACAIAPRSVYVCGGSVSAAGLTVTFSKDSDLGTSLEAGALVIADNVDPCSLSEVFNSQFRVVVALTNLTR